MRRFRVLIPLFFLLLLAGCYSDQRQQLSACVLQAQHRDIRGETAESALMAENSEIELCMGAHGYELVESDCPQALRIPMEKALAAPGAGPPIAQLVEMQQIEAACYEPMAWLGKQARKAERALGYAPKNSN